MSFKPAGRPEEYASALRRLSDVSDLAALLDVAPRKLIWYAYGGGRRYHQVLVPKRRGGHRTISQPVKGLKIIQQKLHTLLAATYHHRTCVHGFVMGKSIATNAAVHAGRQWVFNADLEDFFPSINFGRIRGRLMAKPLSLPPSVATVCAQLCSYHDELPQGAPTSPILSNIVSSHLDSEVQRLASRYGCRYTRYADDLTLSTDAAVFPAVIGSRAGPVGTNAQAGLGLVAAVESGGFSLNLAKTRLQRFDTRQEVTGITVNEFPNVPRRNIRRVLAMLRAWRVHGYENAEAEFLERYDKKHRPFGKPVFRAVVKGHIDFIAMVRGSMDPIYERLLAEFASLDDAFRLRPRSRRNRSHLPRLEDSLWVVETEHGLGTGFELEGHGLITCAHVLCGNTDNGVVETKSIEAWQPSLPTVRVQGVVEKFDVDRDLAVIALDRPSGRPLRPRMHPRPSVGAAVWAAGFPNQTPGDGLWRDSGTITRHAHHIRSPRLLVSFAIVEGSSGSPVMDKTGRVVGVASMGAASFEEAAIGKFTRFGVIPIGLLGELHAGAE